MVKMFFIVTLSAYRMMTFIIYNESGPFGIFDVMRTTNKGTEINLIFECPKCLSVYTAVLALVLYRFKPLRVFVLFPLAISSLIIILDRIPFVGSFHDVAD